MTGIKQKIEPEVCTYFVPQTNIFMIEVVLPNALKKNIHIKDTRDALLIKTDSDNINYAKYIYLSHTIWSEHHTKIEYCISLLRFKHKVNGKTFSVAVQTIQENFIITKSLFCF